MHEPKSFSIKVMGAFDLLDSTGKSVRPTGRKDCAILAILALTRNHRQTRTWLQDKLWGDRGPAQGAASLRQALTTLRNILNAEEEIVQADRTWVWLNSDRIVFDHLVDNTSGEILRGFDLRDEGFNEWLRETRTGFHAEKARWGPVEAQERPDRRWHLEVSSTSQDGPGFHEIADIIADSLAEALSVIGVHTTIDRRGVVDAPTPRATDMIVSTRVVCSGAHCLLSIRATDGFGSLLWQVRRETGATDWSHMRATQAELAQLFQDFVIKTEANSLRGTRWSAYSNGCQALLGILVPGSMSSNDISQHSEAAIAASEKGIYHALLGDSKLLMLAERTDQSSFDMDEVMNSFRTALRLSPENGLVNALAGHSFGFFAGDMERNFDLTNEAIRLLPGSGVCWLYHSIALTYAGKYEDAVAAATCASKLCRGTVSEPMAKSAELFARLMYGDTDGAIRVGRFSLDALFIRPTVADLMTAYSRAGRMQEGRKHLHMLVTREPDLSIDLLRSNEYPIVNPEHRAAIVEAAGALGLR